MRGGCSKLLDPIFQEIAEIAEKKSNLRHGSAEWKDLDFQAGMLYSDAKRIFAQYNPDFQGTTKRVMDKKERKEVVGRSAEVTDTNEKIVNRCPAGAPNNGNLDE